MNINDLFDNIAHIFNQFAEEILAEHAHKNMLISGREPEGKGKDSENIAVGENQIKADFLIRE